MHRPEMVCRVEHLLASGALSLRGIAGLVRISRGSVATIRDGRHPHQRADSADLSADDEDRPLQPGPIDRCPTCGGMVEQPCRACHCRTMPRPVRAAAKAVQDGELEPLGLELDGEARERYEKIRARKVEAAGAKTRSPSLPVSRPRRYRLPAPNQLPLFDSDPPPWELDDAD